MKKAAIILNRVKPNILKSQSDTELGLSDLMKRQVLMDFVDHRYRRVLKYSANQMVVNNHHFKEFIIGHNCTSSEGK